MIRVGVTVQAASERVRHGRRERRGEPGNAEKAGRSEVTTVGIIRPELTIARPRTPLRGAAAGHSGRSLGTRWSVDLPQQRGEIDALVRDFVNRYPLAARAGSYAGVSGLTVGGLQRLARSTNHVALL